VTLYVQVEAGRLGHEGGGISRLGLLLVASSDGTARVYAVPDPHDLARRVAPTTASTPSSSSSSPERLFITAIPACEFQLKDTVLLSVRWFFLNGRVGVLVGAVNGNVGYWHIRPTIPFFQFTPMVPSYSGLAHPRAIKGLCFSPLEPYRFISAGHDSHVRFWDLRDPAQPIYDHAATGRTSTAQVALSHRIDTHTAAWRVGQRIPRVCNGRAVGQTVPTCSSVPRMAA